MSLAYKHALSYTLPSGTGLAYFAQTTGNFYLRKEPYSTNTYTGSHIGGGVWDFGTIEDGYYQLWNATSQNTYFGTQYLGDKDPTLDSLSVTGDVSVSGQVNFYNSFNMNSADVAHVDNLQVNSLSENVAGAGIRFDHRIQMSDALRTASNFASLTSNNTFGNSLNRFTINPEYIGNSAPSASGLIAKYHADATYGRLGAGNNWLAGNNFTNYPLYTGNTTTEPTTYQFTTRKFVENAVLSATLGSVTSTYISQVSPNVVRLLPNGLNNTTTKVATTWSLAMKQCKDSITASPSSATKQMIVSVEGIGESDTAITITNLEIGTYFYPRVHTKGLSQSVRLRTEDASMDSGGSASACIVENLTIFHDDGGFGATPSFANMTFKDCYFDMKVDSLNFSSCIFRGTNILNMRTGTLSLNSVSGTTYYTTLSATETGVTPPYIVSPYL